MNSIGNRCRSQLMSRDDGHAKFYNGGEGKTNVTPWSKGQVKEYKTKLGGVKGQHGHKIRKHLGRKDRSPTIRPISGGTTQQRGGRKKMSNGQTARGDIQYT